MKVLVGKTFGIGNMVMCVPMLKALRSLSFDIDMLVGSFPDDIGAIDLARRFLKIGLIDSFGVDHMGMDVTYDVAIMSIPFDGRWKNGKHFKAKEVMDGRTRPDPSTTGLSSWKNHEILYQMENARTLGYDGPVPSSYFSDGFKCMSDLYLYLGVGYKKDRDGFWSKKHWGNDNFREFLQLFLDEFPHWDVLSTGDILDWKMTLQDLSMIDDRCHFSIKSIDQSIDALSCCSLYVGNDTGMMHIADSFGIPCVVPFFLENSIVKSKPFFTKESVVIDGVDRVVSPKEVMNHVRELIG